MLTKFFSIIMTFICLLACSSPGISVTDATNDENEYLMTNFPTETMNLSSIYVENCQPAIRLKEQLFLLPCRNTKKDTKNNYGLRLFLIEMAKGKPVIRFQSHGTGDSYYLRPSVFKTIDANYPLIILAESGAEFSYGVGVYLFDGLQMKYIGELDVTVNEDNAPGSAVSFVKIRGKGDQLIFSFTKDVLMLQNNGEYRTIPKEQIRYKYSGKRLEKMRN